MKGSSIAVPGLAAWWSGEVRRSRARMLAAPRLENRLLINCILPISAIFTAIITVVYPMAGVTDGSRSAVKHSACIFLSSLLRMNICVCRRRMRREDGVYAGARTPETVSAGAWALQMVVLLNMFRRLGRCDSHVWV
ncbi:hypothetical protein P280DRAFT_293803 [Massarina eburnea CBS 473.64]|uniref:Uncharacterized protein n=1 Tax=Massarina eburnea CBS 473.64 TaxID=1395130 RepID=A0A6A6S4U1_9PLEO|nr:hypothetical protein P280DRAFT_293803 [Massarina eburnea CBS 473.64]